MAEYMDRDYDPRSVARKLSSCKRFFKYLLKNEYVTGNPVSLIIAPKVKKRLPKALRSDELSRVQETLLNEQSFAEIRDDLIVNMLYATGMRRSEIIDLRVQDIAIEEGYIRTLGKGQKERRIPIGTELSEHILSYISLREERRPDSDHFFVTDKNKKLYPKFVYNVVKRSLALKTSSKHITPHALRHSFATHLLDEGADINAVKELLGHANLAATEVYTHNTVEKLKRAYKGAHPRS